MRYNLAMLPSMDLQRSIRRGMRRGVRAAFHERRMGAALTLFSVILLFQFLLAALLGVRGVTQLLVARGDLRLEVISSTADTDVQKLYAALRGLPYVDSVAYVSREQALERERTQDPDLVAFLEKYQMQNPFPDSFSMTLLSLDHYDALRAFIEQSPWKSIVHPSFFASVGDQEHRVRSLLQITRAVGMVSGFFLLLAAVALTCIVVELVRRRAQRTARALRLEELLGASVADVLLPFITEVSLLLLLALLAASALVLLSFFLLPILSNIFAQESFVLLRRELWHLLGVLGTPLLLLEVLLAPMLAWGGAVLGLRRGV